ncbi:MAG: HDOD domain-containing protein [bacterium]
MERDSKLKTVVDRIINLPTLPNVLTRVLALTESEESSAGELAETISYDQSLAMRILKIVNSAYFGIPRQISSLRQAVVILGFNNLKSLALSVSIFNALGQDKIYAFDRVRFWEHSIGCAVVSKSIGRKIDYDSKDIESCFTAGLIHDIGKVVFDKFANKEFTEAVKYARQRDLFIIDAEREIIGVTHEEIGKWLAERWQLPLTLVDSIGNHHPPGGTTARSKVAEMVHLANMIVRRERVGNSGDDKTPEIRDRDLKPLGLDQSAIEEVIRKVPEAMRNAETSLSLT